MCESQSSTMASEFGGFLGKIKGLGDITVKFADGQG